MMFPPRLSFARRSIPCQHESNRSRMQGQQSLAASKWNERIVDQRGPVGPVRRCDPEKSLEKLAHGALRQITGDENQTSAMVVIGPAFEPCGGVKYVLHAMHDDRCIRHFCKFHDAFDAQKLFAVCRTQQLEKHLQSSRRNCIVGCENKRADVLVMTISVVLMVVMAMDVRI